LSTPAPSAPAAPAAPASPVVNDFVIRVGTVNGSGSQTSNMVLLRTAFQTGVPCSGKNVFPSNIQGLPTWFEIRLSPRGYVARRRGTDFLVAMNPETAAKDLAELLPGGAAVYDAPMALEGKRKDVTCFPVPFGDLVAKCCPDHRLRRLVVNMIYVGVAGRLLGLERTEIDAALARSFKGKPKALDLNRGAVDAGWKYAEEKFPGGCRFQVRRPATDANKGKILVDGNAAAALGACFGGVGFVSWYPITPSSSLGESLTDYLDEHRRDAKTGKATYAVVQAEDELAAVGMAVGAGWAGARAMTTTSGPGISLMAELTGFAYYAEIPIVIVDVQRAGPSTGLPTRTAQGDLLLVATLSHGDTRHPMLFPASVGEAYAMTQDAFDRAERWQTPVFVMSDLDLGMNVWTSDPFPYPDRPLDRGKVLSKEDLARLGRGGFFRYADPDGDGIPYRTLPGTPGGLGAYFTRGSGHDEKGRYTEDGEEYRKVLDRLLRKWETIRRTGPAPEILPGAGGKATGAGILAFGTTWNALTEALDQLREEKGLALDACRLLFFPFHDRVREFLEAHPRTYVVEQNRDAQMRKLLSAELPDLAPRLRSVLSYDGWPIDARTISSAVAALEDGGRP
jgi:2-oxoglutarate ferredoxin oxidoreductase subunit alpha